MAVERLMKPDEFCEALRHWAKVYLESRPEHEPAFATVRLAIEKSCLLDRLIYGGEKIRTRKCPIHKGVWSGCTPEPCWLCYWGCNVTGWIRNELSDAEVKKIMKRIKSQSKTG